MVLEKVQEILDKGLCHLYYGLSFLAVLAQELYNLKDHRQMKRDSAYKEEYKAVRLGFKHKPQLGFCSYLPDVLHYGEKIIKLISSLNARWLRTDFPYSMLGRGESGVLPVDEIVEKAYREGIQLLPILGTWTVGRPKPPKDSKNFLQYVEKIVSRYNGRIDSYEFWNEPNCVWFWRDSVNGFCELMDSAARKVKEVDPKIKFGVNIAWHWSLGCSWALKFIRAVSKITGLSHVDFIGLHGYPGTWETGNANTWRNRIRETKETLKALGHEDKEIWVTEFGFYAFKNRLFYPHIPRNQTEYFREAFKAMAEAEVPVAIWYCLHDPLTFSNFNLQRFTYQEFGFGLYTKNLKPKDPMVVEVIRELAS